MLPLLQAQEEQARASLPPEVLAYCAAGSGDQQTRDEARAAWQQVRLRPRVLRDVSQVTTATTLLGAPLAAPVLVGPTALHGAVHPDGERATAQGCRDAGSLLVLSTRSSTRLEDVGADPWWLQVYVLRDRGLTRDLVQRAGAAGARALVLTGDTPVVGDKTAAVPPSDRFVNLPGASWDDTVQDASVDLATVGWLAQASGLPVLVKGVLRGDDALACLDAGAAGVVVSNHGGRQLDRAVATARALPEVADAVAGRAPVLVDGGVRSGLDVLCALALGADAVLLGRPVLWALAAGGADGVAACLRAVRDDLAHVLALAGARAPQEVGRDLLA